MRPMQRFCLQLDYNRPDNFREVVDAPELDDDVQQRSARQQYDRQFG